MSKKQQSKDIVKRLRALADFVESHQLEPAELTYIQTTLLVTLEAFFSRALDFLIVVGIGDHIRIQNWINVDSEKVLYEAAGRLSTVSVALGLSAPGEPVTVDSEYPTPPIAPEGTNVN